MSNRKLDALFEERVLGVTFNASANPFREMPSYTGSLDAAWPGLLRANVLPSAVTFVPTHAGEWTCCFSWPDESCSSTGSTPALAFVTNCLLSVGVSQDEIDGCGD